MKKIVIVFVGLVIVLFAVVQFMPSNNGAKNTTTQTIPKRQIKVKKWDGRAVTFYNATFIHSGQSLTLVKISFTNLERKFATVAVTLNAPRTASGKTAAFVKKTSFKAVSPAAQSWYPSVQTVQSGANTIVRLLFKKIPSSTIGLGINASQAVQLNLPKPGGSFQIGIISPAPPAGHKFGEHPLTTNKKIVKKNKTKNNKTHKTSKPKH